jgi:hypothetical protein
MVARTKPTPARVRATVKEGKALELRKSGATFDVIAHALKYADRSAAAKAVRRALAATVQEPAAELRRLELERCDAMTLALWPAVLEGDAEAIRACLRVMLRRAQMLGLDAPAKSRVEVITHDAFSAAMEELEAEIAELEIQAGDRRKPGRATARPRAARAPRAPTPPSA